MGILTETGGKTTLRGHREEADVHSAVLSNKREQDLRSHAH
jgi:hypothetical protein